MVHSIVYSDAQKLCSDQSKSIAGSLRLVGMRSGFKLTKASKPTLQSSTYQGIKTNYISFRSLEVNLVSLKLGSGSVSSDGRKVCVFRCSPAASGLT